MNATTVQVGITAGATLLAVILGGWVSIRAQDRHWHRDTGRQWTDRRLETAVAFVAAWREYIAYIQAPSTTVTAIQRSRPPHDMMPVLDGAGVEYARRLDATKTAIRLVTNHADVVEASRDMVHQARHLAAARATTAPADIPAEVYAELWAAERQFVKLARTEFGLHSLPILGDRTDADRDATA